MENLHCCLVISLTVLFLQYAKVDSMIFASEWPVSASIFENSDVEFFCEVRGKQDNDHLVWFTDMDDSDSLVTLTFANETVDVDHGNNGGQHSIEYELTSSNTYRLIYRIKGVKVADEGLYACGYVPLPIPQSVSGNNILGDYATLQILVPPSERKPTCTANTAVITSLEDNNALGMSLSLLCQITGGRPTPELTWYKNNDNITTASTGVNQVDRVLEAADNGVEFTCVASGDSLAEDGSCSFIPLQIPPTAAISASSTLINPWSNATFSCIGDGLPFVSDVDWFINGVSLHELEDFDYDIISNQTESSSELTIQNAHFDRKHNTISCVVRIPSGLNSSSAVTVVYSEETTSLFPLLLPIVAASSGLLVIILVVFIAISLCKSSKKGDDFGEDIYQRNNGFDENAQSNPYQEDVESGEPYVISNISSGVPRGATMGSDHPYATIRRDEEM